jgi:hypothetical protein
MRSRLAFLARLWDMGVRFKKLVLFTGLRDLYPAEESISAFIEQQDRLPMQPGCSSNLKKCRRRKMVLCKLFMTIC